MRVKCIDNSGFGSFLDLNREYQVDIETETHYKFRLKEGYIYSFYKDRFEVVENI